LRSWKPEFTSGLSVRCAQPCKGGRSNCQILVLLWGLPEGVSHVGAEEGVGRNGVVGFVDRGFWSCVGLDALPHGGTRGQGKRESCAERLEPMQGRDTRRCPAMRACFCGNKVDAANHASVHRPAHSIPETPHSRSLKTVPFSNQDPRSYNFN